MFANFLGYFFLKLPQEGLTEEGHLILFGIHLRRDPLPSFGGLQLLQSLFARLDRLLEFVVRFDHKPLE